MINREAPKLTEALRLQKLRAADYLLDFIARSDEDEFRVAIELKEDVYTTDPDNQIFEQNKCYDESSSFTLNSEEILKSLCSFLDIWYENEFSHLLSFCFLSTNSISKEGTSKRSKKLGLKLPQVKIIEELGSKNEKRVRDVLEIVKLFIIDFYSENYKSETEMIIALQDLSLEMWTKFLLQIDWIFEFPPVEELEKKVLNKIADSKLFSSFYKEEGQESIKAGLLDLIEKKSYQKGKTFRLVSPADLKLLFLMQASSSNSNLQYDDVHKLWENIETPDDGRNFSEKILSVCPDFSPKRLAQYERKVAIAKVGEERLKNQPEYLSLKYRVFDFCDRQLFDIISELPDTVISEKSLIEIIENINKECTSEFQQLRKQFNYGIERDGIILELFVEFIDSCYLAFD